MLQIINMVLTGVAHTKAERAVFESRFLKQRATHIPLEMKTTLI